ncbi:hypothetical protein K1719_036520 [Acacia pycnantha]|nr:hypothetical protein K1719_036520 [Acacia pycnantha]
MKDIANGETLYKAICGNDWDRAKQFLNEDPSSVLTAKITSSGKTALHVAALFGHVSIVKEMVNLLSPEPELLETTDDFGNTPLFIATITGITQVAECLVNKNTNILGIVNSTKELPITQAFLNGHQEMGRYLYSKTPLEYLHPEKSPLQGAMLLRCCLQTQCFDIALDLLNRCPELLFAPDKEGWKPMHGIATMNSAIPSRNELVFWKRLIFDYINSNPSLDHDRLPIQQQDTSERAQENFRGPVAAGHRLLQRVISSTYNLIGTKKIQEQKLLHAQADKILDLVCKNAGRSDQVSVIADALFLAAEERNVEFVLRLSKANPDLLLIGDRSYQNIFCYAVGNRQARVFNLIHGLRFKDVVVTSIDKNGNTLLHVAAAQAPTPVLNRIYGPTLQMQRELQWFTEVESLMPATIRGVRNNDGMTAEELFKEKHQDLMKQGEKWSSILNVIPKFYGRDGEDPYQHLLDLYETISPFTPPNANLNEGLRHSFQFAAQGDAKEWLRPFPQYHTTFSCSKLDQLALHVDERCQQISSMHMALRPATTGKLVAPSYEHDW